MKNLIGIAISFILVMLWTSTSSYGQSSSDADMKAYRDELIKRRDKSFAEGTEVANHLSAFEQIIWTTKWYKLIQLGEMEDYFRREELTTCLYVYDEIFDNLPNELITKMFDKKNKAAIQEFLKHYISFEKHETIVDIRAQGKLVNLKNEGLKFDFMVKVPEPGSGDIMVKFRDSGIVGGIKFSNTGNHPYGLVILLHDFLPGSLDYFKD